MKKQGFLGVSAGKESACNAGDLGSIPGLGRSPWRRERQPIPIFWPGEFYGLYSPWGCKQLDTTQLLSLYEKKTILNKGEKTLARMELSYGFVSWQWVACIHENQTNILAVITKKCEFIFQQWITNIVLQLCWNIFILYQILQIVSVTSELWSFITNSQWPT